MSSTNNRRRMTRGLFFATCLLVVIAGAALVGTGCDTSEILDPQTNHFEDNGDGTVTHTKTGLVWLKNANCFGELEWDAAMASAAALSDGQCGLTDGSVPGDWRLPSMRCPAGSGCSLADAIGEFASIFAPDCGPPHVLDTAGNGCWSEGNPFSGVQSRTYYSSTECGADCAWEVYLWSGGALETDPKYGDNHVWPVRNRR